MKNFQAIGRFSTIAAAVALIATPAFAASNDPTTDTAKPAPKAARYCVEDSITGSRLPRKVCKTRAEWISQDGFDPLARN